MWRKLAIYLILVLLLAACDGRTPNQGSQSGQGAGSGQGSGQQGGDSSQTEVSETQPTATSATSSSGSTTAFPGLALPMDKGRLFSGSGVCNVCHTRMADPSGADVSIDTAWRASMLANAARDPYWLATVRSEIRLAPELSIEVQKKCANCHMPMAEKTLVGEGSDVHILDGGLAEADHPLYNLALDGVSCTLCHQVEADNFLDPDQHSGAFLIDMTLSQGGRLAYGPFHSGRNLVTMMSSASGFIPQQSMHVRQAEMCASCHDLYTPYIDATGAVVGEFPEQLVYSEWENSDYATTQTCQDCHMPLVQGNVQLSVTGGPMRSPVLQHIFVGGNAFMLRMLQQNGEVLRVGASTEQFETSITRTSEQIASQTARISLQGLQVVDGKLIGEVLIENLAGHKFPAGYPSRRTWLQIRVTDADSKVVFESGAVADNGAISGNDNDLDASRYEPHYTLITSQDQVQIYEGIMVNSDGEVTTMLLRAAKFIKDNRLLPVGYKSDPQEAALNPQGEASQDVNFAPGGDTLSLELDLGGAQGPFTLEVRLLYQSIAFRWADNLRRESSTEVNLFGEMYDRLGNLPLVAGSAEALIEP